MRKILIAALVVLGPAASYAQAPQGVNPNAYLRQQLTSDKDTKSSIEQMDYDICIEVVGDHESVAKSEGWKSVTEISATDQLTILLSKGKKRERMTCYRDQLIVDKWTSTLK